MIILNNVEILMIKHNLSLIWKEFGQKLNISSHVNKQTHWCHITEIWSGYKQEKKGQGSVWRSLHAGPVWWPLTAARETAHSFPEAPQRQQT